MIFYYCTPVGTPVNQFPRSSRFPQMVCTLKYRPRFPTRHYLSLYILFFFYKIEKLRSCTQKQLTMTEKKIASALRAAMPQIKFFLPMISRAVEIAVQKILFLLTELQEEREGATLSTTIIEHAVTGAAAAATAITAGKLDRGGPFLGLLKMLFNYSVISRHGEANRRLYLQVVSTLAVAFVSDCIRRRMTYCTILVPAAQAENKAIRSSKQAPSNARISSQTDTFRAGFARPFRCQPSSSFGSRHRCMSTAVLQHFPDSGKKSVLHRSMAAAGRVLNIQPARIRNRLKSKNVVVDQKTRSYTVKEENDDPFKRTQVEQLCILTGKVQNTYNSAVAAVVESREFDILLVLDEQQRMCSNGFYWRYAGTDDFPNPPTKANDKQFYCYLLESKSKDPKYAGVTYVGWTDCPQTRLGEHNAPWYGKKPGTGKGAKATSVGGPWRLVVAVSRFGTTQFGIEGSSKDESISFETMWHRKISETVLSSRDQKSTMNVKEQLEALSGLIKEKRHLAVTFTENKDMTKFDAIVNESDQFSTYEAGNQAA